MPDEEPSRVTVVLIDADDFARDGVAKHIADDQRFVLLRAARGVAEAQLERLRPALVLCDPRGRTGSSLDVMEAISAAVPGAQICIHTTETDPCFALDAGRGRKVGCYLIKGHIGAADLLTVLDLVARSVVMSIDLDIAARFSDTRQGRLVLQQPRPGATSLSERELKVLRLYGGDQRVNEIARRLHIDHRTVSAHLRNAREKFGAGTNPELVRLATEQGLLDPDLCGR
jgi:DNA-binding NarL/FixJ family response regulator